MDKVNQALSMFGMMAVPGSIQEWEAEDNEKVVYNFHCYEPMVFTHQGAYWVDKMPRDFRISYPKTLEEYGVIDQADPEDRLRLMKDIHAVFLRYGIGHALWNYKQKDFGLVDDVFKTIKDRFIEIV